MVTRPQIQSLVDQIVASFPEVETIILFGSHAYGAPTRDSDVDLLVVMEHVGPSFRAASRVRLSVDPDFPLDLIVRHPAVVARALRDGDRFINVINTEGVVLYEAKHRRMDRKGGSGFRRRPHPASVA